MRHEPADEQFPDTHHDEYSKTIFGFWVYLLSDFMLFGTLLAAFEVLKNNTFGGPPLTDLFTLRSVFVQSLIMLVAATLAGLGGAFAHRQKKRATVLFFLLTFFFGALVLGMQIDHYRELIASGNSWTRSGFLSSFFTVMGTFSLHIIVGLLWTLVLLFPLRKGEMTMKSVQRLSCLRIFWQFLNIVWVFICTLVYLLGVSL